MLSRRVFVGGLAVALATPHVALAQKPQRFQPGPELAPRIVALDEYLPAGEIHVDPNVFALYLTLPDYKAWRYTVAVSKPALWEPGTYHVKWMAEWPRWRPTNEMIRRNPAAYAKYRGGMPGGQTTRWVRAQFTSLMGRAVPICAFTAPTSRGRWAPPARTDARA